MAQLGTKTLRIDENTLKTARSRIPGQLRTPMGSGSSRIFSSWGRIGVDKGTDVWILERQFGV